MAAISIDELLQQGAEHIKALIMQAYESGRAAGEETAKQKVLNLFGTSAAMTGSQSIIHRGDSLAESARVSRPLLETMLMMRVGPEGVGPKEVAQFVSERPNMRLDIGQVRAGIKTLEKRGDLIRVSRGRFRPSVRLLGQSEDQETEAPNSGEPFGAPKTNGAVPLNP
jgi:hypothetical protein